jgi:hypothetical protein
MGAIITFPKLLRIRLTPSGVKLEPYEFWHDVWQRIPASKRLEYIRRASALKLIDDLDVEVFLAPSPGSEGSRA